LARGERRGAALPGRRFTREDLAMLGIVSV
jgi:hypothetical protein